MLKTVEDITPTKKRLKIEIPAEALESEIKKGLQAVQSKSKMPGFRQGKAPMSLIEKRFGRDVESDVLEKIIPEFYANALKEAAITPVASPAVEETFDFKRNEPLYITVSVDVMPKVEPLNYENLTVKDIPVNANDEEVEAVIKGLAEERAAYESVDDAVVSGDLLTIDYSIKEEGITSNDVVLKVGSGPYSEEFFQGLTGRKKDEEFELEAALPADATSGHSDKNVKYDVKIKEIKRRNVSAVDDEFAKDFGFDNIGILKEKVLENILAAKGRDADTSKQREIMNKLLDTHSVDLPESLLDAEINSILGEIRAAGRDSEKTDEQMRAEILPHAEKSVKAYILMKLIGEKEGISVKDEDIKEEIISMAMKYRVSPENIMKYYTARDGSLEGLKNAVFEKKVLTLLLSKAKLEQGE